MSETTNGEEGGYLFLFRQVKNIFRINIDG